jgi:hypothetical protein
LSLKKFLLKKYLHKNQSRRKRNDKKSSIEDEELTAEDVDDLGDFAADIAEQPLEESIEGEVSRLKLRPKKYRKKT